MIIGIGVDTVDLARFAAQIQRTPALVPRLFTPNERAVPPHSLAARFAAKEALVKALAGSRNLGWQDLEIERGEDRAPHFVRTAALERELAVVGASRVHVSMTHDGPVATAFVIIEGDGAPCSASDPVCAPTRGAGDE